MDLAALRGERTTWPNDQHRRRTTAPITPKYENKVIVNLTHGECLELTKADCVAKLHNVAECCEAITAAQG